MVIIHFLGVTDHWFPVGDLEETGGQGREKSDYFLPLPLFVVTSATVLAAPSVAPASAGRPGPGAWALPPAP